jgi:hypothetical protein
MLTCFCCFASRYRSRRSFSLRSAIVQASTETSRCTQLRFLRRLGEFDVDGGAAFDLGAFFGIGVDNDAVNRSFDGALLEACFL